MTPVGSVASSSILTTSSAPLKARLIDQAKIAGIGNLLADDMLYRSGLAPNRPANSLSDHEQAKLHRSMRRTIEVLGARGGSHTGDLQDERKRGGVCPRCPTVELCRDDVGGRTTYWCADCQN